ncbi:MAG: Rne/Rng family ribonuclease [Pseudomonadota bacterium]
MAEDTGLDGEKISEEIPQDGAAKRAPSDAAPADPSEASGPEDAEAAQEPDDSTEGGDTTVEEATVQEAAEEAASAETTSEDASPDGDKGEAKPRKRQRRPRRKKEATAEEAPAAETDDRDGESEDVESLGAEDLQEEVARARSIRRRRYKIQDVVKVRQIMLVQVVKEERGNKGAALTTYLSLAGRYCVLMPNTARGGGISRKITNVSDRKRLREIVDELEVPKGMGLIVRTAGAERTRPEIKRDYEFLSRQWESVRDLTLKSIAPTLIYEEGSLIKRSIRDLYSKEIDTVMVEGTDGYREAKDYMKMLMPSHAKNVQQYGDPVPLYARYQVESYLNGMFSPTVQLKSGGYIVIGVTEALVAIDVNSGRATKQGSIEETALQTNLEAADEVARQCRLRDLAGLIVIDFIDMEENRNNRAVEKRMKDRLKNDRARIQIGRISSFGLMEMSRQRLRPGLLEATTQVCPVCKGMGIIRSDENMALSILREVEEEAVRGKAGEINITAPVAITNFLINQKREHIAMIESRCEVAINVLASALLMSPDYEVERAKSPSRQPVKQTAVVTAGSVVTEADLEEDEALEESIAEDAAESGDGEKGESESRSRRRRGKRGGRRRRGQEGLDEADGEQRADDGREAASSEEESADSGKPRRRRRRRKSQDESGDQAETAETADSQAESDATPLEASVAEEATTEASEAGAASEAGVEAAASVPSEPEADQSAPEESAPDAEATEMPNDGKAEDNQSEESTEVAAEDDSAEAKELELATADAGASQTAENEPKKPKRRGWWSLR